MTEFVLSAHYFWMADRQAPTRLPGHPALNLLPHETPDGRLRDAGDCAVFDLRADVELMARLRDAGAEHVDLWISVLNPGDEAPARRVTSRLKGDHLDMNAWYHDDPAQATPEQFQIWMRENIRAALESWLQKHGRTA